MTPLQADKGGQGFVDRRPIPPASDQTALKLWFYRMMGERPGLWARFVQQYERLRRLPRRARRRLAGGLAGLALVLALSAAPAGAANITVFAGEVEVIDNNKCSLIEAIENADDQVNGQLHNDCAAGNPNGQDTITLPAYSMFTLSNSVGTYFGSATGLPRIDTPITIEGNGADIRRTHLAFYLRTLAVGSNGVLTLNDTVITGGSAEKGGGIFVNGGELELNDSLLRETVAEEGGALFNFGGLVNVNNTVVIDSTASRRGGGIYNTGTMNVANSVLMESYARFDGGGLFNSDDSLVNINNTSIVGNVVQASGGGLANEGTMVVTDSFIDHNAAWQGGGGITNSRYADLTINHSTISGNSADFPGGGIDSVGALAITNSKIAYNIASRGGGIYIAIGDATITGTTLDHNSAKNKGGGLFNGTADTFFINSTLSGNTAKVGGGAFNYDYHNISGLTFINSTVTGNSALRGGGLANDSVMTLIRTLVSGNQANTGDEIDNCAYIDCKYGDVGILITDEFNLLGHSGLTNAQAFRGFLSDPTDITATSNGTQPTPLNNILSPNLKFNGGPTQTHALAFGSPALDRAPNVDCNDAPVSGVDQRGQPRNVDADDNPTDQDCDIGAFERALNKIILSPALRAALLQYQGGDQSEFFSGPRAGLPNNARFDAVDAPDPDGDTVHLSFTKPTAVPGLGRVPAQDVVTYDGRSFTFLFDGSDVGLSAAGENIDALAVLDGAVSPIGDDCRLYLLISTKGNGNVPGPDGRPLRFRGEDVVGFCALDVGEVTRGVWHLAFDGSAEGLPANSLTNLAALDYGQAFYFMTSKSFRADGVAGRAGSIYRFDSDTGLITGPYWATTDVDLGETVSGLGVFGDLLLEDRQ